jgi:hypothetical protein
VTSAIQTQLDAKADVTGETFTGDVRVQSNTLSAFRVAKGPNLADIGFSAAFALGAGTGSYWNGSVMRGYSDAGTTETFSLSAATGDFQTDGDISAADVAASGTLAVTGASTFNNNVTLGNNSAADTTTIHSHFHVKAAASFSVVVGAAAGTGGSVGATRSRGSDQAGEIQVTTGASGTSTGALALISFAYDRPSSDYLVFYGAHSTNAGDLNLSTTSRSVSGFTIQANAAPGTGETLNIAFWVVEVDA